MDRSVKLLLTLLVLLGGLSVTPVQARACAGDGSRIEHVAASPRSAILAVARACHGGSAQQRRPTEAVAADPIAETWVAVVPTIHEGDRARE
jgi:cytochrome c553